MKRKVKRLGLLTLLAGCLHASQLAAQPPASGGPRAATPMPGAPMPGLVYVGEEVEVVSGPVRNRPTQRAFNNCGMCCASDFNQVGCGNFWSEVTFIFGSCRTFFGQPCVPNPPYFGPGSAHYQKCCGN
jgi:hypothetical protein